MRLIQPFNKIFKATGLLAALLAVTALTPVAAQEKEKGSGDVTISLLAHDKNAEFEDKASFTFHVDNPLNENQVGKVSYIVTDPYGAKLHEDSIRVNVHRKSTGDFDFTLPTFKTGFYKVNFAINVTDYDDTIKRAFGIRPEQIRSTHKKPADFDDFWNDTKAELAKVKPMFKMTEMPDSAKDNRTVYLVEMRSLDNITVRGWLTIPNSKNKSKKHPVMLALPGYQVNLRPLYGTDPDLAMFSLNVRGQGNSKDVIHTTRPEYIYYRLQEKNKYVMRGVIMDCIRAIDFLMSRPEIDHDRIMVNGGSMGGYLTVAVAGLDKRIQLCSSHNPILADVRASDPNEWPLYDIEKYIRILPGVKIDQIFNILDYYDAKNFAQNIHCKFIMGIGLLDKLAPPTGEYALYNSIPTAEKKIFVFKDLGHEVTIDYVKYESLWMRDEFALF